MRIDELRRNPEKNPRTDIFEVLSRYKDRDDVFVTFVEDNKLGINPSQDIRQGTPFGIYAYTAKSIFNFYHRTQPRPTTKMSQILPYAGDRDTAIVFTATDMSRMLHPEIYTEADFEKDHKRIFDNLIRYGVSTRIWDKVLIRAQNEANPFYSLWFLTKQISKVSDKPSLLWARILKDLGYDGAVDPGYGYIHANEEAQAMFFSVKNLKIIGSFDNKRGFATNDPYVVQKAETAIRNKAMAKSFNIWMELQLGGKPHNILEFREKIAEYFKLNGIELPRGAGGRIGPIAQQWLKDTGIECSSAEAEQTIGRFISSL